MQLRKLAVICNICFWLTLFFQYWPLARKIHAEILGTIVILGLFSVLINLVWLLKLASHAKQKLAGNEKTPAWQLIKWFNILSFAAQLIFLYLKYL